MEAAVEAAFDEVRRLDRMLSNYRPDSEWSEVNRTAARRAGQGYRRSCSSCFQHCLDYSRAERRRVRHHGRAADEGLGVLQGHAAACRTARKSGTAMSRIGYRNIVLDPESADGAVSPRRSGNRSGRDRQRLRRRPHGGRPARKTGSPAALVSAGRAAASTASGAPPDEPRGWRVSIPDPRDARQGRAGSVV